MPVTRRLLCGIALVAWLAAIIFFGKSNFAVTAALSLFLGITAFVDIALVGIFARMSVNSRSEPIAWLSVAALMPRDGHVIGEDNDVMGVILDVTDLRLKETEIST